MAETPPGFETKDLPHSPLPTPVPAPDRIGYEESAAEQASEQPPDDAETKTTSPRSRKTATEKSG